MNVPHPDLATQEYCLSNQFCKDCIIGKYFLSKFKTTSIRSICKENNYELGATSYTGCKELLKILKQKENIERNLERW